MRKFLSAALVVAILLCLLPAGAFAALLSKKDGYILVPTMYGAQGVDAASAFVLTVPVPADLEAVAAAVSIDGQPAPDIAQAGSREFIITPAQPLANNALYTFRLARAGESDLTWVFQTAVAFGITGSLPGNQATNVPVDTGIELIFSTDDYDDIDSLFSISPAVAGRFQRHGKTVAFVPAERLQHQTVYTVTLKAGLARQGGTGILAQDYSFSFETAPKEEKSTASHREYMFFSASYAELPSDEAPVLSFFAHDYEARAPLDPQISVYRFPNSGRALEAVWARGSVPYWAYYAQESSLVDTSGLRLVASFLAGPSYDSANRRLTLPDALSQGFYLIDAQTGHSRAQIIIQISDLPIQVVADVESAVVWVNDIAAGGALEGATVYDENRGKTYLTDENGVALLDRIIDNPDGFEWLTVTAKDGRKSVWFNRYSGSSVNAADRYWKYLRLDRSLFQPDDPLYFWGFVQNRYEAEDIPSVKAVLTKNYGGDTLHSIDVTVHGSTYSGEIPLPRLDAGSYSLHIYHGTLLLSSTYFSVARYDKPAYTLAVSPDKAAVFADEPIAFGISSSFFEGTPVAALEVSHSLSGSLIEYQQGTAVTSSSGIARVSAPATPRAAAQGSCTAYIQAEAILPETGSTLAGASVRVFINDINVQAKAVRQGKNGELAVAVNSITLDRLNNGTAENYYDYLGSPVEGQKLNVDIYRAYWVKEEKGNYYDYIEKKVLPTYWYTQKTQLLEKFTLTADSSGSAQRTFALPDSDSRLESYYAEITCLDGNGRTIRRTVYIGEDYSHYYFSANQNRYYLDSAKTAYAVGEEVCLTMMRGDTALEKGNFLFVRAQGGITEYHAGYNPYTFTFTSADIPNTHVYGYYFDGRQYQPMYRTLHYDYTNSALAITLQADREAYRPGDTCTITVTTSDQNGKAVPACVNLSVVDEALLALRDYTVSPLESLYHSVGAGISFASATHRLYYAQDDDMLAEDLEVSTADFAPAAEINGDDGGDAYLRDSFKDTALFHTVDTDSGGTGTCTFTLPDNITSWRVIAAGISGSLHAGSAVGSIAVTVPAFISYTFSDIFLTGDAPVLGVNAYGTALTGSETVLFEIWDEADPGVVYSASGTAFGRVNIPLWQMDEEGSHALVIRASVNGAEIDRVRHAYQVLGTYRQAETARYYDVDANTVFDTGDGGITEITFTDKSRGQYLYQLLSLRHCYGDRLEKHVVSREALRLAVEYFPETGIDAGSAFDPRDYQQPDGGLAILPYSSSDLLTTVKLMPYVLHELDQAALKNYLYSIYHGDGSESKLRALYGLAMLKEPVLLDLDAFARLDSIPVTEAVYLALGFLALGEAETAAALYEQHIAPRLEYIAPYYRVSAGLEGDILEATSAACLLATALEMPQRDGLYTYCQDNRSDDLLAKVDKLAYLTDALARTPEGEGSVTYTLFGESHTRTLKNGGGFTLRIPADNISGLKLVEIQGQVAAVSRFMAPLDEIAAVDADIKVTRTYYSVTTGEAGETFSSGDLIRVVIDVSYADTALRGSFTITDFLPAGLRYVSNSAKTPGLRSSCYARADGQKVSFYDYFISDDSTSTYVYFARVICPGVFTAEGVLAQNLASPGYIGVGGGQVISVN